MAKWLRARPSKCTSTSIPGVLARLLRREEAESKAFSYRSLRARAGVSSRLPELVIDCRVPERADGRTFRQGVGLDHENARYFCCLVSFSQAPTSAEKAKEYAQLTSFRSYRRAHKLDLAHAAYYGDWYMPVIRELAAFRDFREEPAWIAEQLVPAITRTQAARALETLMELGLLVRDEQGRLVQADALVSTGPETTGLHIAAFHRAMTSRALESIDLVPKEERDISSLTLGLSRGGLVAFKQRLQRFRRELLELSALEDAGRCSAHFQLFPLSRVSEARKPLDDGGSQTGHGVAPCGFEVFGLSWWLRFWHRPAPEATETGNPPLQVSLSYQRTRAIQHQDRESAEVGNGRFGVADTCRRRLHAWLWLCCRGCGISGTRDRRGRPRE